MAVIATQAADPANASIVSELRVVAQKVVDQVRASRASSYDIGVVFGAMQAAIAYEEGLSPIVAPSFSQGYSAGQSLPIPNTPAP